MTTDEIKNPSLKVGQCFEHLKAHPGDQPLTDRLMCNLRQLTQGSQWLLLHKLVSIYGVTYEPILDRCLDRYHQLDSLKTVLRFVNLYKYKDPEDQREKIYPHQRRLGADILKRASDELLANLEEIKQCRGFDELLQRIESATRPLDGFGQVALYDTALRIGAKLDRWPKVVYLHAGTMEGYKNLCAICSSHAYLRKTRVGQKWVKWVRQEDLCEEVRVLKPHHAENFLCIFKAYFKNSASRPPSRPCC